jgi:glycosyltransferase involved in cell wall biosynthesis
MNKEQSTPMHDIARTTLPLTGVETDPALRPRVVVVMPAYNAARTLRMTYTELPHDSVDMVILVDDGSTDDTVAVARELNLKLFLHDRNYGYGANQKTCYAEALRAGADIVVMVHPDYQYDPRLVPEVVHPIQRGEADVVLGSRLKSGSALSGGMPKWKYVANRFLTGVENLVFGLHLSEYHTGYRAYRRGVLEGVNFTANADRFIFDQEIIAQIVAAGFRITEVAVPTRYFAEASTASLLASVRYGLGILWLMGRYLLHRSGWWTQRQFQSLRGRYRELSPAAQPRA